MTESLILDSLPYFDTELEDPALKEIVDSLLAEEMKTTAFEPPIYEYEIKNEKLKKEMERIEKNIPFPQIDTSRYSLPNPTSENPEEWLKELNNARAQLESQRNRITNLELFEIYGESAWRKYAKNCEHIVRFLNKQVDDLKNEITNVNRQRKMDQIKTGRSLENMEARYREAIEQTMQIKLAISFLENQMNK